jgi:hypothetical protein
MGWLKNIFKRFQRQQQIGQLSNSKNPHLLPAYRNPNTGEQWYVIAESSIIPYESKLKIDEAIKLAGMGLSPAFLDEMDAYMNEVRNVRSGGKIDFTKVFALWDELMLRRKLLFELDAMLNLCACFAILEDENPYEFNDAFYALKVKKLREDREAQDFFLRIAISMLPHLKDISEHDFLTYLQQSQSMLSKVSRASVVKFSPNMPKPSTSP